MKPQDLVFIIILGGLIFLRKSNYLVVAGLLALLLAIPLFAEHIFFTAEHLTYYAAGFFLVAVFMKIIELRKDIK